MIAGTELTITNDSDSEKLSETESVSDVCVDSEEDITEELESSNDELEGKELEEGMFAAEEEFDENESA